jgi:hypothetical protein
VLLDWSLQQLEGVVQVFSELARNSEPREITTVGNILLLLMFKTMDLEDS